MTKQVTMFEHERDYIGLDITITDNYGAKTRVVRNAIYSDGKDDLYILMNEFKRALVVAGYSLSTVNHIQYLDTDEMKKAEAAGIIIDTIDD